MGSIYPATRNTASQVEKTVIRVVRGFSHEMDHDRDRLMGHQVSRMLDFFLFLVFV